MLEKAATWVIALLAGVGLTLLATVTLALVGLLLLAATPLLAVGSAWVIYREARRRAAWEREKDSALSRAARGE